MPFFQPINRFQAYILTKLTWMPFQQELHHISEVSEFIYPILG
jgi:hypothetical protein